MASVAIRTFAEVAAATRVSLDRVGDGFCYLLLYKEECREGLAAKYGAFPSVASIYHAEGMLEDMDHLILEMTSAKFCHVRLRRSDEEVQDHNTFMASVNGVDVILGADREAIISKILFDLAKGGTGFTDFLGMARGDDVLMQSRGVTGGSALLTSTSRNLGLDFSATLTAGQQEDWLKPTLALGFDWFATPGERDKRWYGKLSCRRFGAVVRDVDSNMWVSITRAHDPGQVTLLVRNDEDRSWILDRCAPGVKVRTYAQVVAEGRFLEHGLAVFPRMWPTTFSTSDLLSAAKLCEGSFGYVVADIVPPDGLHDVCTALYGEK